MAGVERVFVSYHQFEVGAGSDSQGGYLEPYTVGDGLIHLTGRNQLTVMTGPHTGWVEVGVEVLARPPGRDPGEWEEVSEATLWSPDGRISVCGLMGDCPDGLWDVPVGRPGLLRVRVRARDRRPEDVLTGSGPQRMERYEVLVWPVGEDTGRVTLRRDGLAGVEWEWRGKPGRAATWALVRLVALARPEEPHVANLRRVAAELGAETAAGAGTAESMTAVTTVRRSRVMAAGTLAEVLRDPAGRLGLTVDGHTLVLPVSVDLAARLSPDQPDRGAAFGAQWRWEMTSTAGVTVPDPRPSRVELRADANADGARLTVTHHGVAEPHGALLGLVWEYLLERAADAQSAPHHWIQVFDTMAAEAAAAADAARRARESHETRRWGGHPPSERLRSVPANTIALSNMDRPLLDALAETTPEQQRAIARWATRQACNIAGLTGVDWIAAALAALDRGEMLPPPFDNAERAWERLWSDPRIPQTVVTTPSGTPNFSQQALAFPTITQATHDDPLAAVVDALAAAMYAHGPAHRDVASACRTAFPQLDRAAHDDIEKRGPSPRR